MSVDTSIAEFFIAKKARNKRSPVSWAAKRKAFIKSVDRLYERIEKEYLRGAQGSVAVEHVDFTVREEEVGEYPARELVLTVGDEKVRFVPKGIVIYGAAGRVDVCGERGTGLLVLDKKGNWGIVTGMSPSLRFVPLNAETLLELLRDVMRP